MLRGRITKQMLNENTSVQKFIKCSHLVFQMGVAPTCMPKLKNICSRKSVILITTNAFVISLTIQIIGQKKTKLI